MGHFGSIPLFLNMEIPTQWSKPIFYLRIPLQIKSLYIILLLWWPTPLGLGFVSRSPDRPRGPAAQIWARSLTGLWTRSIFCPTTSRPSFGVILPQTKLKLIWFSMQMWRKVQLLSLLLKMMLLQLVLRLNMYCVLLDYLVFSNIRNLHILSFLQHK